MSKRMPCYFISHGGGPWPWMPQMRSVFANLERSLVEMVAALETPPKAILMVSGHWETEAAVSVMSSPRPPMVYDYYNFPPHTYEVQYPSPGAPELAQHVFKILTAAGIDARLDPETGYDHGTFVPMHVMYPEADVPLFQVSILKSYNPAAHVAIGQALASLRDEGIMIVGSGLSYHNLRQFSANAKIPSRAFDDWLMESLSLEQEARAQAILDWESAPFARSCHPREDHLVPLFVALGAAEDDPVSRIYRDTDLNGGISASSFRFG